MKYVKCVANGEKSTAAAYKLHNLFESIIECIEKSIMLITC